MSTPFHPASSVVPPRVRGLLEAAAQLPFVNPFEPRRFEIEKKALGPSYVCEGPVWCSHDGAANQNLRRIGELLHPALAEIRDRLAAGARLSDAERLTYQNAGIFSLYDRFDTQLQALVDGKSQQAPFYDLYVAEYEKLFRFPGSTLDPPDAAHLFALFFQARRAFHYIFSLLLGGSLPAARLRADVWWALFGKDMDDYQSDLFRCMDDVSTLITGPSGTGKELVARIIAYARYIPFDPKTRRFATEHTGDYHPRNLCDEPESLIEAALFGHRRGTFSGATADRIGWFSLPKQGGTLLIDELGELTTTIQVKLLRVLQDRRFVAVGDTVDQILHGRLVFATNQDLAALILQGRFRTDLLHRIQSYRIRTPSLREQLDDAPGERRHLVKSVLARLIRSEKKLELRTDEVDAWMDRGLAPDYPWTGNMREFENCVRNVLLSGRYVPEIVEAEAGGADGSESDVLGPVALAGGFSLRQLNVYFATKMYALNDQNLSKTSRLLDVNPRTAERLIDREALARMLAPRR
jgi:hypothetical protein